MGRNTGWLALAGGESSGAYIILLPEYDFDIKQVNKLLLAGAKRGTRYEIIVVAEGAKPKGLDQVTRHGEKDGFGHFTLGGIGDFLAEAVERGTGIETRCVILSHLQRGGAPCAFDRRMGRYFGIAAVDLIVKGAFGKMVSYLNGTVTAVPIETALGPINMLDVRTLYDTERYGGRRTVLV
jgi:6-phosphofructokinase 1